MCKIDLYQTIKKQVVVHSAQLMIEFDIGSGTENFEMSLSSIYLYVYRCWGACINFNTDD